MKNLFLLLGALLFTNLIEGQIIAHNDNTPYINGVTGNVFQNYYTSNVLSNDSFNGGYVSLNFVTLIQTYTSNSSVNINTSNGYIDVSPGTPAGTYYIYYQICENANNTNCSTAAVQVNVCSLQPPTISNLIQPDCNTTTGSLTLNNLPTSAQGWIIKDGGPYVYQTISSGNGSSYTLNNISSGEHNYYVVENSGCISGAVHVSIIPSSFSINLSGTSNYVDYNADGFINVGDIVNFQFSVTNTGSCDLENVSMYPSPTYYTITSTNPIAVLPAGTTDNTSLTGSRVLTQNDINLSYGFGFFNVSGSKNGVIVAGDGDVIIPNNLGISDGIKLNAFIDTNNNGIQDIGEVNYLYGTFTYQINSGVLNYLDTFSGEAYLYENNSANSYNLSYSINPDYINCSSQYIISTSSYSNVTVANGSGITTYNFPITIVPCSDVSVYLSGNDIPRPGISNYRSIYYSNKGNSTINGTITYTKDTNESIISISSSGAVINTNGFTFDYFNLLPGEHRFITVNSMVPSIPTVQLGQLLTNSVVISPADGYMANNTSTLTQAIVSSYDPNLKSESHGGKILHSSFTTNDYLTYTIQFENTGNANAVNIRVNDVLNTKLDETSLKMVAASHDYVLERVGTTLNWKFNGINLPPSVPNTQTGHGYVTFQIKPKSGYAIGDVIPNLANIYFDFNPAIVTNVCNTQFVSTLSNQNFALNNLNYYPNPVKNSLTISNSSTIDEVEIISILGQKMISKKVNDLQAEINLSELLNGVYFVKVSIEGQEKTFKIVKE